MADRIELPAAIAESCILCSDKERNAFESRQNM